MDPKKRLDKKVKVIQVKQNFFLCVFIRSFTFKRAFKEYKSQKKEKPL